MIFILMFKLKDPKHPIQNKNIECIITYRCMIIKNQKNNIFQMMRTMIMIIIMIKLITNTMIYKIHLKIFIKNSKFNN